MQVARSVGRGSRRGAKGGVRIDDPKQLFCIRPAMEAFVDEQPSLVPLVRSDSVLGTERDACSPSSAAVDAPAQAEACGV
jgi:hypothetical protein